MPTRLKFSRPSFEDLKLRYSTASSSVHSCSTIDPTIGGIGTCAARMSEALVFANRLVEPYEKPSDPMLTSVYVGYMFGTNLIGERSQISRLGSGKGDGRSFLLGRYGYGGYANVGNLCPHGIGRGAGDLAAFLKYHWGARTLGWTAQAKDDAPPPGIMKQTGVVAYLKIPGYDGQGHIDLWDGDHPVGAQYWTAETIWFWKLA